MVVDKIQSYSDFVKSVKRVNQRINETNRVLGQKSHAYNEFASRLELGFKQTELNTHRDGYYQLSRSRAVYERLKKSDELGIMESLEDVQTMRERRKKVKEYVPNKKLSVQEQNDVLADMDSFLGNMADCMQLLYNNKENEDVMQAISIMQQKGKKSYDELFIIQKIAKKYKGKGSVFDDL